MTTRSDSRNVGTIIGALSLHDVTVARVIRDDHWYQLVAEIAGTLYRISCKPTITDLDAKERPRARYKIYTTKEERSRLFDGTGPGPDAFCFADGVHVYWIPAEEMNVNSMSLTQSGKHETDDPRANPVAEYELEVQLAAIREDAADDAAEAEEASDGR